MTPRALPGKLLSPAGFGLVLLCFLLPFVTVSCGPANDELSATFTGLTLVTGGEPEITGTGLTPADVATVHTLVKDDYDLEPLAVFTAMAVLAGMACGLLRRARTRHLAGVSLAGAALVLLIGAVLRAEHRLESLQSADILGVDAMLDPPVTSIRYGFWLAASGLLAVAAGHGVALARGRRASEPEPDLLPDPPEDQLRAASP